MLFLRHLVQYLLGCVDQAICLKFKHEHGVHHYVGDQNVLEIFTDSDWASHKATRRFTTDVSCTHPVEAKEWLHFRRPRPNSTVLSQPVVMHCF